MLPVSSRVTSTEAAFVHPAQLAQQPGLLPQVDRPPGPQVRRDLVQQRPSTWPIRARWAS